MNQVNSMLMRIKACMSSRGKKQYFVYPLGNVITILNFFQTMNANAGNVIS